MRAKLFMNGGSQAVRLPAEFRFDGTEVEIRRDPASGGILLMPVDRWANYLAWLESQPERTDWFAEAWREQPEDEYRDPFHAPAD